jgi:hypothetical protein
MDQYPVKIFLPLTDKNVQRFPGKNKEPWGPGFKLRKHCMVEKQRSPS